ncbi:acyl-CoA dehydrogenase family protein [Epibacterium sp. MM17-32]|uniref:acyl-CoA dehydrogenase family protein n=1 Tax=Epibacterium sp. MM17-32 TaxID=2917734 RepID=UPI001EF64CEE|nr:acyl-CoA dehydrogenase family protein [Epibacterium sp. MM17-32]MCG7626778.1 acyl-CoA dehydrogenase family protein [Epibacterium sp. MM17-32]
MFNRTLFDPEHDAWRAEVSRFLTSEVVPQHDRWVADKKTPRDIWRRAGAAGLLGRGMPRQYGGAGRDFRDSAIVIEELARHRVHGLFTCLQSDIVAPFILRLGTDAQKDRLLPALCQGETLGALALTEPQGGSAMSDMATTARNSGESLVLNGCKTHISNGSVADVVIVAAQSERGAIGDQPGLSLVLVETERPGISQQAIQKCGMPALDTGRISLEDCIVPRGNLLGAEGMGFVYLMSFLGVERLVLAIYAQGCCERILQDLIRDCDARRTPQGSLLDHQTPRFALADLYSECAVNRSFIDQCIPQVQDGRFDPKSACIAKLRTTATLKKLAALGVQLRGAGGISGDSGAAASQDLLDASVQSIWGGTSEILQDLIGRSMASGL